MDDAFQQEHQSHPQRLGSCATKQEVLSNASTAVPFPGWEVPSHVLVVPTSTRPPHALPKPRPVLGWICKPVLSTPPGRAAQPGRELLLETRSLYLPPLGHFCFHFLC